MLTMKKRDLVNSTSELEKSGSSPAFSLLEILFE
jgi:hypothetical protein